MNIPPQAIEIEESVIGSMLLESSAVDAVLENLTQDDFYSPFHQNIFHCISSLHWDAQPVDLITVEQKMKDEGFEVGKLYDLPIAAGSNVENSCQIIKEKSIKRNLIHACTATMKECYDSSFDAYDAADKAQERIFGITDFQQGTLSEISETIQRVAKQVSQIQESGEPIGIRTGLDIDNTLQGFQGSKLYILGARPSMGKTALVMTLMRNLARQGRKTGILSLETSDEALGVRLIAQVSGIPAEKITSGKMNAGEYDSFMNACQELSGHGIFIDDKAAVTAQQVRSKCRIMANKGVEMIFIDFLQLIKGEGRSKHEEIGNITKVIKQVSKELDIPVIALSQLSRKVEERNDKRPMMADLRESGSIEEDADCVMFLYRPEYYGVTTDNAGNSTAGVAEIIVAKNKDGRTGTQKLFFRPEVMRFENLKTEGVPF